MGPVFAYVDPGSGSAAYQMALAGFLAIAFFARRLISSLHSKLTAGRPGSDLPRKSPSHAKS
jgi:hypothetical protein